MDNILVTLFKNYPELENVENEIMASFIILKKCYENGGKLLVCGNGGSAADSDHIVGELLKGFKLKRPLPVEMKQKFIESGAENPEFFVSKLQGSLPAISLCCHSALITAWCNDVDPNLVFAQQVYGLGKPGDVLIAISTSGNAENVTNAVITAKTIGLKTIGVTGRLGGKLSKLCDAAIKVPAEETYRIQEYHLPIYHALCAMIEEEFFS